MEKKREPGFYQVRGIDGEWTIAKYCDNGAIDLDDNPILVWEFMGSDYTCDDEEMKRSSRYVGRKIIMPDTPTLCGHCAREIEHVDDEPDYEYDGDRVIDMGMMKIYSHVHSGEHLCDSGETGAIPKEVVIDPNDEKRMKKWQEMRDQVLKEQEHNKKEQDYDKLCEQEAQKRDDIDEGDR